MSLHNLDGNAFAILGAFNKNAKKQGWTREEIDSVITEAKAKDYWHLVSTILTNTEEPE